jgi:hypothetical protein
LGYGVCAPKPTPEVVDDFIERLPEFTVALAGYEQSGNSAALEAIEERALGAAAAAPRELRKARRDARRAQR